MRGSTVQGYNKDIRTVACRNNRTASGVILDGQPVYLQDYDNATNFGVDVVTAMDTYLNDLKAGIAKVQKTAGFSGSPNSANPGDFFEAVCYGFTDAIITYRSRAASTDTWATAAAIAVGDQLVGETTGGNLIRQGTLTASNAGLGDIIAAQSAASRATGASTFASGNLVDTIRMKVFVRAL